VLKGAALSQSFSSRGGAARITQRHSGVRATVGGPGGTFLTPSPRQIAGTASWQVPEPRWLVSAVRAMGADPDAREAIPRPLVPAAAATLQGLGVSLAVPAVAHCWFVAPRDGSGSCGACNSI